MTGRPPFGHSPKDNLVRAQWGGKFGSTKMVTALGQDSSYLSHPGGDQRRAATMIGAWGLSEADRRGCIACPASYRFNAGGTAFKRGPIPPGSLKQHEVKIRIGWPSVTLSPNIG
jgi:hypothetical protein